MTALSDWDIVSDAELACAAAAGDRAAFAGIYDRYADRLHDFCLGMVRDRDAAADCVQDVFCTAAGRLSQLREPDKLRPWLYAIARNEALRCIRQRRREQVSEELPEAASADPGPDTLASRSELAELIAAAAGGLSDRDRSVLELAYRHGLDGPELAEVLAVSPTNATKMVSRLRETIERSLGALLVARRARTNPTGCTELGAILAGWDGQFTVLMRKRIARHIESCPACDQERRKLVSPAALLGGVPVFIPAPDWLRHQTLSQIHLTATTFPMSPAGTVEHRYSESELSTPDRQNPPAPGGSEDGGAGRTGRMIGLITLLVGTVIASMALTVTWLHHSIPSINPVVVTGTAPEPTNPGAPHSTQVIPNPPPPPALPPPPPAPATPPPPAPATNTSAPAVTAPPSHAPQPTQQPTPTASVPIPRVHPPVHTAPPPPPSIPAAPADPTTAAGVPPVRPPVRPPVMPPVRPPPPPPDSGHPRCTKVCEPPPPPGGQHNSGGRDCPPSCGSPQPAPGRLNGPRIGRWPWMN